MTGHGASPVGMKARSELTGDRERQAETTCPRFGAATRWMSIGKYPDMYGSIHSIEYSSLAKSLEEAHSVESELAGLSGISVAIPSLYDDTNVKNEVTIALPRGNARSALRKFGEPLSSAVRRDHRELIQNEDGSLTAPTE